MFHAFANKLFAHKMLQLKRQTFDCNPHPIHESINIDFFFFSHDCIVHALCRVLCFESWHYVADWRLESFKKASIDVVRVNACQSDRAIFVSQFLSQSITEASHSKFTGNIIRIPFTRKVSSNRIHIDQMIPLA